MPDFDWCLRVWRLTKDGQRSIVAGGSCTNQAGGDGGPAASATFKAAVNGHVDLATGPDGSLYIANRSECRVRRIGLDGIITTVAGTTCPSPGQHSGDGGAATAAKLIPASMTVGKDGVLYVGDDSYWQISCPSCAPGCPCYGSQPFTVGRSRIRTITDGLINSIAGTNVQYGGQGVPALQISLNTLSDLVLVRDSLWYAEWTNLALRTTIDTPTGVRRISPPLPGPSGGSFRVPSKDGAEIYEFDGNGTHLRTLDGLTSAVRYQFGYTDGLLTSVTDANNLVAQIVRGGDGIATAIVAPNGQQTSLGYADDGYLVALDQPGGIHHELTYYDGGLLRTFRNPNGNVSTFSYDDLGRVTGEQMPGGCSWALSRTGPTPANIKAPVQVTITSAEGRARSYTVAKDDIGNENRTNLSAAGLATTVNRSQSGAEIQVSPDGTQSTVMSGPDPRGDMQSPIPASTVIRTPPPSGKQMTMNMSRVATVDASGQNLIMQVDTTSINGKASTSTYNAAAKTVTTVSPVGRQTVTTLDDQGRVVQVQAGNLAPTAYGYDARGRLETVTVGTGTGARVTTFGYDELDRLTSVRDPLTRVQQYIYDDANRVVGQIFPDTNQVAFGYDPNGNVTSVTPPSRPTHTFGFTPADLMSSYTPPAVSGTGATTYEYDLDKQPTVIHRPDGSTINFTYDSAGRLATTTYSAGPSTSDGTITVTRSYNPTTGKLSSVSTSDGQTVSYGYDGSLLTSSTWSGAVTGSVSRAYNNDLRLASESVNGANSLSFGYDNDGLLTGADGLTITRDPTNGMITDTSLGSVTDHRTYDSFGQLATYEAKFGTTSLYSVIYTRDNLGRIETKAETLQGTTTTWAYSYDSAGRLWQVMKDGVLAATYLYDSNGNRLGKTTPAGTETATYDEQDRLLTYGKWAYTHTANGELRTRTDITSGETTRYSYDGYGNLRQVDLPSGHQIQYVVDSSNRRIAKKLDQVVVRRWLYRGNVDLAAELDASGAVVTRHMGGAVIRGGKTYRVIGDVVASPRLVVDVSSGAVAQRLDFDEWGIVLSDTAPGFQVLGLAGGVYDPDTGFVRFGARDYDPTLGRWTTKDPIGFGGRQANVYVYVDNNPVGRVDLSGLANCYYSIASHSMECYPNNPPGFVGPPAPGTGMSLGPDGVFSGQGECKNNPECSNSPNQGPIPPRKGWCQAPPLSRSWDRPSLGEDARGRDMWARFS